MAGTTTNFAIPYPSSTDYVTDGATAMRSLADQVDAVMFTGSSSGNLIINGAMQVSQRSVIDTAVTGITTTNYYTADRFQSSISSFGTWSQTTSADAPTGSGFRNSLKMVCTTAAASLTGNVYANIIQNIEGQNCQAIRKGTSSAQTLTLSFWVKAGIAGTYIAEVYDSNSRQVSKAYTISAINVWEYKTIVIPADTSGVIPNSNVAGLAVRWWLGAGTSYTSGTLNTTWAANVNANIAVGQTNVASGTNAAVNYWQMTGAQITVGSVAVPFQFKSYADDLRDCQRYYYRTGGGVQSDIYLSGYQPSLTNIIFTFFHPVQMRATPSLVQKVGTWLLINSPNQPIVADPSIYSYFVYIKVNSGITSANQSAAYTQNSSTYIEMGAEL
jgi:hypothetical protein